MPRLPILIWVQSSGCGRDYLYPVPVNPPLEPGEVELDMSMPVRGAAPLARGDEAALADLTRNR